MTTLNDLLLWLDSEMADLPFADMACNPDYLRGYAKALAHVQERIYAEASKDNSAANAMKLAELAKMFEVLGSPRSSLALTEIALDLIGEENAQKI